MTTVKTDYSRFIWIAAFINAVKELSAKVDAQAAEIEQLRKALKSKEPTHPSLDRAALHKRRLER